MKDTKNILKKFESSQIEEDTKINGGASSTMTYMCEKTYVVSTSDTRHFCDTTLSDEMVIGISY